MPTPRRAKVEGSGTLEAEKYSIWLVLEENVYRV